MNSVFQLKKLITVNGSSLNTVDLLPAHSQVSTFIWMMYMHVYSVGHVIFRPSHFSCEKLMLISKEWPGDEVNLLAQLSFQYRLPFDVGLGWSLKL